MRKVLTSLIATLFLFNQVIFASNQPTNYQDYTLRTETPGERAGRMYYYSTSNVFQYYNAGSWVSFVSSAYTGDVTITGTFTLSGTFNHTGDQYTTGNVTITGDSSLIGNVDITGTTDITGQTTITGNTSVIGTADITGTTTITGATTLVGDVTVSGDLSVTQTADITLGESVAGLATFTGGVTISSTNPSLQVGDGTFSWGHTPMVGVEGILEVDGTMYNDGVVVLSDGSATAPSLTFNSDTTKGFYHAGSNLIGIAVGGALVGSYYGDGITSNNFRGNANTSNNLLSRENSDGSAIAFKLDATNTLTTAGDKLVSIQNNTVEKVSIDKDGGIDASSTISASGFTDGTLSITSGAISDATTIDMSGDLTDYEATNDASPEIRMGSADADELHIQSVYDSGAQTLDYVLFQTDSANVGADKGQFVFNVDGSEIVNIDDGGLEVTGTILGDVLVSDTFSTDSDGWNMLISGNTYASMYYDATGAGGDPLLALIATQQADDSNGSVFSFSGGKGGEKTTSGNGVQGGSGVFTGGVGSDANTSGDGGSGGAFYIYGGAGGAGAGAGSAGSDGNVILAYSPGVGALGKVGVRTSSPDASFGMTVSDGLKVLGTLNATTITDGTFSVVGGVVTGASNTNWDAAYSHISNNGSDHSYIDQDVTSGSTPTFTGTNFSGIPIGALPTAAVTNGDTSNVSTADAIYDFCETTQAYYNAIGDLPTATPSNGDTTHVSTADQIYDYIDGLGYMTPSYTGDVIITGKLTVTGSIDPTEIVFDPIATTAAHQYGLYVNTDDSNKLYYYDGATHTEVGSGGTPALSDITDPTAATSLSFDDDETITFTTAQDSGSFLTIDNTVADLSSVTYLLDLEYTDDGDADARYVKCVDNSDVTPNTVFEVAGDGDITSEGVLTLEGDRSYIDINQNTSSYDAIQVTNASGNVTSERYLLNLAYNADADQEADFIVCTDDADGTPGTMFEVEYDGDVTAAGAVTVGDDITLENDEYIDNSTDGQVAIYESDDTRNFMVQKGGASIYGTASDTSMILYSYSDGILNSGRLLFYKSHVDVTDSAVRTEDNEELADISVYGVDSEGVSRLGGQILFRQDGVTGTNVPTELMFRTATSTEQTLNALTIYPDGGLRATHLYADTGTDLILNAALQICTDSSSIKYKKNVRDLDLNVTALLSLTGKKYETKHSDTTAIGLIAEDVAEIYPDIAIMRHTELQTVDEEYTDEKGKVKTQKVSKAVEVEPYVDAVNYKQLTVLLLEMVKLQQAQIDDLEKRVEALEKK